jgi:hypothetical protein
MLSSACDINNSQPSAAAGEVLQELQLSCVKKIFICMQAPLGDDV